MSRKLHNGIRGLGMALLGSFLLLALSACNDDPKQDGSMRVSLTPLKRQMGINGAIAPAASEANSLVHSIVIGPIVVGSGSDRTTPYSTEDLSEKAKDQLIDDALNSVVYIQIVGGNEESVEFVTPPPSAGAWQLMVAGFTDAITTLDNIDESAGDTVAYYGFSELLYKSDALPAAPIPIIMRRACRIDTPPKGCAAYKLDWGVDQVNVTSAVEIHGVFQYQTTDKDTDWGPNLLTTGPFTVRTSGGTHTAATAKTAIEALARVNTVGTTLNIVTTHELGVNYAEDCGLGTDFNNDPATALTWLPGQTVVNPGGLTAEQRQAAVDACFQSYPTPYF